MPQTPEKAWLIRVDLRGLAQNLGKARRQSLTTGDARRWLLSRQDATERHNGASPFIPVYGGDDSLFYCEMDDPTGLLDGNEILHQKQIDPCVHRRDGCVVLPVKAKR